MAPKTAFSFSTYLLNLDDLDFRIIRELGGSSLTQWNVRESYSNIARKLGIDEETVRLRVNRARERGFLPNWRMMVNPLLLNRHEANLDLEVREDERKAEAISKIRKLEGVHSIVDFRGKGIMVIMYYKDNLEDAVHKIESICGSSRFALWDSAFLRPDVQMKQLDWKIIYAMQEDAWRDLEEVAKLLGVSCRTVQRRLVAMKEGRAIYLSRPPNADVVGGLMCNFLVFFSDAGKKRAADYVIYTTFNRIGASDTSAEKLSRFGISCENFAEADRVTERLRAIDGVTGLRMRIIKEIIVVHDWLKSEIAEQISK